MAGKATISMRAFGGVRIDHSVSNPIPATQANTSMGNAGRRRHSRTNAITKKTAPANPLTKSRLMAWCDRNLAGLDATPARIWTINAIGFPDWLHTGQRVGVQPLWTTCGRCEYCLTGREELCQSKDITGETVNGGYAEYMLAKALHCYPVPDEIDDVEAAPLFCPGITAYSAVSRARLAPGRTVGVFGIGGVGHMVLQFAGLTGAEVIAVTRSAVHGGIAGDLGAARVIDAANVDPVRALKEIGGVDSSIVFAPASDVVQQAVEATKPGGTIVVGVSADISRFAFADEKRIVGSVIGPRQGMMEVLALAAAGKVKPVCDTFALEDAPDVLLRLKHGEIRARAVLKM